MKKFELWRLRQLALPAQQQSGEHQQEPVAVAVLISRICAVVAKYTY